MLALQLTAFAFLLLSAAFMFGPQIAIYGARALPRLAENGQARFVGGVLLSITVFAAMAPQLGSAMTTGGDTMTVLVADLVLMNFRFA